MYRQSQLCNQSYCRDYQYIRHIIYECDVNEKGYLSTDDLQVAMVAVLGYKARSEELEELLVPVVNCEVGIPFNACEDFILKKLQPSDQDAEIREIFMALDTQCRGFITVDDLLIAFGEVAPMIPKATATTAFRNVDFDRDGRISYKDFQYIMKLQLH